MPTESSMVSNILRIIAAVIVVMALILMPAPLLPPHYLAEKIQFYLVLKWKVAYLVAAIGLQGVFFFSIGALSAFVVRRSQDAKRRILQIFAVPLVIVTVALIIRSAKMGHFPVWVNAAIPIAACTAGVWLGLGLVYRRSFLMFFFTAGMAALAFWALLQPVTPELSRATAIQIRQLIDNRNSAASGDAKFGTLLQRAFTKGSPESDQGVVLENRAAILALGVVLGDERLARFIDLDDKATIQQAVKMRKGATLRGRADWARHFSLSAALAVMENSLVSDASGLLKEQVDAQKGGTGFSFGDFAADRAGVRFAIAATYSEEDAKAMQDLLRKEFNIQFILPSIADLPENMTAEQFRERYGATGSEIYREQVNSIEQRLDSCIALSPLALSHK